ncbi:HEAT repeat domain-containing protein [Desulfovibrio cuneatus]|uniref:HEAT repeat domain-containing protein n=1 Tax=Desulfovibrio cuneatus TaxID=159728 RepID=UPI00040A8195|nr:HEAT repeat domain-containing protein [Desulfovibrio cuneatus]
MPTQETAMTLLQSADPEEMREGAYLAGKIRLEIAVPLLFAHLQSKHKGVQEAADYALRKIGGPKVVQGAIPLLSCEDAPIRNMGMEILRERGAEDLNALTQLLHSNDPDIRIFITDILGSVNSPLAIPHLCHALLHDPEVNVRYQAAISLGSLAKMEAAECLNKALHDEEWVQFAVIEALTKLRAESSVSFMLAALDKASDLVASSIIDALGQMGNIKAVPLLLKRLEDAPTPLANLTVKAIINILGEHTLNLLGAKEVARLRDYLMQAMEDDDTTIQDAAIKGLATVGGEEASQRIILLASTLDQEEDMERLERCVDAIARIGMTKAVESAVRDPNEATTQVALAAILRMPGVDKVALLSRLFWESPRNIQRIIIVELAKIATPEDQPFFLQALQRHTDGTVLRGALEFLAAKGSPQGAEDDIIELLVHPYDDVKEAAILACVALRSPRILDHLVRMIHTQDADQRMMGVYALGQIAPKTYQEDLQKALQDSAARVRALAVEGLSRILPMPDVIATAITNQFTDSDQDVRIAVIEASNCMKEEITRPLLLEALYDADPWVRIRSLEKLSQRNAHWSVEKLVECIGQEEDPLVIMKGIEALGVIGGEIAFRALLSQLNNDDADIQAAAENAIEQIRTRAGE